MAYYGGSIRSPIVISDEDEDAALVDLQLWSDVRHPSTSSQGSEKYQSLRGDERRGSWASNVDELNGTDSYGLDMMPGWSSNDVVDNHAERSPTGKKRKRGVSIQAPSVAPATKRQKKRTKKLQAPQARAQMSYNSMSFSGPSFSTPVQTLQQWPGAAFNPYESTMGLGTLMDPSLAPLLPQDAGFEAQLQLPFNSMSYPAGYFPPMFPPTYQQMSVNTPLSQAKATHQSSTLVPFSFQDGVVPQGEFDTPFVSRSNSTPIQPHIEDPPALHAAKSSTSRLAPSTSKISGPKTKAVHSIAPVRKMLLPSTRTTAVPAPTSDLSVPNPIGMAFDLDPASTHGLFKIPRGRQIKTACAIVMEAVPRIFRNDTFVKSWSQRAAGIVPHHHSIDDKGKVLMVYQSPELAKKAFDSPRLTGGKGRGSIRVWWYRDPQSVSESEITESTKVPGSAGDGRTRSTKHAVVVDLEDGEIEENVVNARAQSKPVFDISHTSQKASESARKQPLSKGARKRERMAEEAQKKLCPPVNAKLDAASISKMGSAQLTGIYPQKVGGSAVHSGQATCMIPVESTSDTDIGEVFSKQQMAQKYPAAGASTHRGPSLFTGNKSSGFANRSHSQRVAEPSKGVNNTIIDSNILPNPVSPRQHAPGITIQEEAEDERHGQLTDLLHATDPKDLYLTSTIGLSLVSTCLTDGHLSSGESAPASVPPIPAPRNHIPPTIQYALQPDQMQAPLPPPVPPIRSLHPANSPGAVPHFRSPPASTPTPLSDTPSEPRAMKNLPKGPRSLLARTKKLEERLARSKTEMTRPIKRKSLVPTLEPSMGPISGVSLSPKMSPVTAVDELSMEENLRRLVLQSRKGRAKDPAAASTRPRETIESANPAASEFAQSSIATSLPIHHGKSYTNTSNEISLFSSPTTHPAPENTAAKADASLDDLASSFINDAIQTPLQKASPLAIKIELAAKQKRLEQQINESKMLMEKLNAASTKAEKERVLSLLRERSRLMDDYMKTPSMSLYPGLPPQSGRPESRTIQSNPATQVLTKRVTWPETSDSVVLMLSDDEDEGSI